MTAVFDAALVAVFVAVLAGVFVAAVFFTAVVFAGVAVFFAAAFFTGSFAAVFLVANVLPRCVDWDAVGAAALPPRNTAGFAAVVVFAADFFATGWAFTPFAAADV